MQDVKQCITVMVLVICTCTTVPETPDAQFEAGMRAKQSGDLDQAFQHFRNTIELEPAHRNAQLELVAIHMNRNEPDHAVAHLTELIQQLKKKEGTSPDTELYARRGHIYYRAGNYQKAIRDTTRALELNAERTDALNTRGLAQVARGNFKEGVSNFRKSLDIEENAQAYIGLARIRMQQGNWKKAVKSLDRAIDVDREYARAYLYRAVAYRELNRTENMKTDLNTYLQLKNPDAPADQIRDEVEQLFATYQQGNE